MAGRLWLAATTQLAAVDEMEHLQRLMLPIPRFLVAHFLEMITAASGLRSRSVATLTCSSGINRKKRDLLLPFNFLLFVMSVLTHVLLLTG